ncbi:MAG: hypothetical protein JWO86_4174, partial [Myxococcaceae bacterium]|nr:hypothetical protein [Myxococcaceae bacterium]
MVANEARLTVAAERRLVQLLGTYEEELLRGARRLVATGHVVGFRREPDGMSARAFVQDSQLHEVTVGPYLRDGIHTHCTCATFLRNERCVHVVAVALTLHEDAVVEKPHTTSAVPILVMPGAAPSRSLSSTPARGAEPEPCPPILRGVYSVSLFLSRLALHAGVRISDSFDRWSPLADWWARSNHASTPGIIAIRKQVLLHAVEMDRDLATLRAWTPPEAPLPGSVFAEVYGALAERYLACRDDAQIRRAAPGPLEGRRHPGFDLFYDAQRGVFEARERRVPLLTDPFKLSFMLPLGTRGEPRFEAGTLEAHGPPDAWDLFALREVLIALHARTEDAVVALERELGRPVWDHVLEQLGHDKPKATEPRSWSFTLAQTYRGGTYRLTPFSRRTLQNGKPAKWKKDTFEALYMEESLPLEREIARVAMCSLERANEAKLALGTPQGHELLRLLGQHGAVRWQEGAKSDPDGDPAAEIIAGDLAMRMAPGPDGALSPQFTVGGRLLEASLLSGVESTGLRGAQRGHTVASVFVPPALRPWLDAAHSIGAAMAFPPESVPRLLVAAQPLINAGVVELPRDALGVELPYEPTPALRVEWQPH